MAENLSRRSAIGLGAAAAAAGLGVAAAPARAAPAPGAAAVPGAAVAPGAAAIADTYRRQKTKAGGTWHTHIAAVDGGGALRPIVDDDADHVTRGYSVQKVAVAVAVLDKMDRGHVIKPGEPGEPGLLTLGTKFNLTADIINVGSGIYRLHTVWGDQITFANFLTALLLMSDNTAVRLCGQVAKTVEINEILAAKGFKHTRVEPSVREDRFFLGTTTPRETHDLLWRLATKTLLTPTSCDFLLSILRWQNGYHDGVRRNMSSAERDRVPTKYGADFNTLGASRHEAGIMLGPDGAPKLTYAMFAEGLGDRDNYGATHPAVQAHAVIGRTMFNALPALSTPPVTASPISRHVARSTPAAPRVGLTPFRPANGG